MGGIYQYSTNKSGKYSKVKRFTCKVCGKKSFALYNGKCTNCNPFNMEKFKSKSKGVKKIGI